VHTAAVSRVRVRVHFGAGARAKCAAGRRRRAGLTIQDDFAASERGSEVGCKVLLVPGKQALLRERTIEHLAQQK
jgi:hypothetical protein